MCAPATTLLGLYANATHKLVSVPSAERVCPTCNQPYARSKRPRTRGHLQPAFMTETGGTRYYMHQCKLCNNEQRDLSLSEWRAHRIALDHNVGAINKLIAWLSDNGYDDYL